MRAQIQFLIGNRGHVIRLEDEPMSVGRRSDCDVRLDDPSVRRKHAEIFLQDGRYWIRALKGDELFVDGAYVSCHELKHRDKVRCGTVVIEYFEG